MNDIEIKVHLIEIAKNILKVDSEVDDLLYLIISESLLAITFISIIEEEFDIEFDDDDIDIEFFGSFDEIVLRIKNYI
jgi:acyl carrier protein